METPDQGKLHPLAKPESRPEKTAYSRETGCRMVVRSGGINPILVQINYWYEIIGV